METKQGKSTDKKTKSYENLSSMNVFPPKPTVDKSKIESLLLKLSSIDMYDENSDTALYGRVSTDGQFEEGYSIDVQLDRMVAYCKAMGWTSFKPYIDPGYSGSNLNRPQIQQLIADVEAGKIKTVVVFKLDRLSRSQKDTLFLLEDIFLKNDVTFVSMTESLDTSTPYGKVMIGILSAFAQFERENIFLRTRSGMLERIKRGYWMGGGTVPFGYDYDKEKGILVPNEDAETVRKIYELYIQGYGPQRIANLLGLKYDRLVTQVLTRRTNLGIIPYKGQEYRGQHEAIVSEEVYNTAMKKMAQRHHSRAGIRSAQHLLTGLLYCGVCGSRMRYIKWGDKGFRICCYSYDKSKPYMSKNTDGQCSNDLFWADQVEDAVVKDLLSMETEVISDETNDVDSLQTVSAAEELLSQIESLNHKLKRLYNLYAESDNEVLYETILENKEKLEYLQKEYERELSKQQDVQDAEFARFEITGLSDAWDYMDDGQKQAVARDCINKIVISHDNIDIYYKFKKERGDVKSSESVENGENKE